MLTTPLIQKKESTLQEVCTYTFKKEDGRWFIYLPDYQAQGLTKSDLEMEGAHKLLNTIANGRHKVTLQLSTELFDGADVLELIEHCDAPKGGAIYLLQTCQGRTINSFIWVCDIALFVFGDMPNHIYVQRARKM